MSRHHLIKDTDKKLLTTSTHASPQLVADQLQDMIVEGTKAFVLLEMSKDDPSLIAKTKTHAHYACRAAWRLDQIIDTLKEGD